MVVTTLRSAGITGTKSESIYDANINSAQATKRMRQHGRQYERKF
jgi:hypothetical protein